MFSKIVLLTVALTLLSGCDGVQKSTFDRSIFRECMAGAKTLRELQINHQTINAMDVDIEDDNFVQGVIESCKGVASIHSTVVVVDSDKTTTPQETQNVITVE